MLAKTFLLAPATALLALGTFSAGGAAESVGGGHCKSRPSTGIGATQRAAVRDWSRIVERRHGGQWADWRLSQSPAIECTGGRHGGASMPECRATALPCRGN